MKIKNLIADDDLSLRTRLEILKRNAGDRQDFSLIKLPKAVKKEKEKKIPGIIQQLLAAENGL